MKARFFWFLQTPYADSLQQRLLNTSCLAAALMMLLGFAINLWLQMPLTLLALNLVGLLIYLGLYLESRFRPRAYRTHILFSYISLGLLNLAWFLNGGVLGAIPLFFPMLIVLAMIMMKNRDILFFMGWTLFSLAALLSLEVLFPTWVLHYENVLTHKLDVGLSLVAVSLTVGIGLYVFRLNYEQEQRLLELATNYKSRFLANMSHELRTPLNSVLGFTQVLEHKRAENLTSAQKLYLSRIRQNGQELLALVNELLDLSRIESGETRLNLETVSLHQILHDSELYFSEMARQKGLALKIELPSESLKLQTDPLRLRQILNNLIGNAIKYTPSGRVDVSWRSEPKSLWLEIQDTGVGIPLSEQTLIFQPFYRLDNPDVKGTGLGLAITRQLCELLGYPLTLSSEPGRGTCFTLQIPLEKPPALPLRPRTGWLE